MFEEKWQLNNFNITRAEIFNIEQWFGKPVSSSTLLLERNSVIISTWKVYDQELKDYEKNFFSANKGIARREYSACIIGNVFFF